MEVKLSCQISVCFIFFKLETFLISGEESRQSVKKDGRTPLYIGGFFDRTEDDGKPGWAQGMEAAAVMAIDDINKKTDILPGYKLHLIRNDTLSKTAMAIRALFWQITNEPTKIMIYGAQNSHVTTALGETSKWWRLIQVTTSFTPEITDPIQYPYVYTVCPTLNAFDSARLALLKSFNWTRVGMIVLHYDAFVTASINLRNVLLKNNITVVTTETFSGNATDAITGLKEKDVRIIIGFLLDSNTRDAFCEAYKQGLYGEKYVWILQIASEPYWWKVPDARIKCSQEQLLNAASHHFLVHDTYNRLDNIIPASGMVLPELTTGNVTAMNMHIGNRKDESREKKILDLKQFEARYEKVAEEMKLNKANVYAGQAYDGMWAIAMTLNHSMTRLPGNKRLENFTYDDEDIFKVLEQSIKNISFEGQSGHIKFTERKDSITQFQLSQVQDGIIQQLAVFDPDNNTFIWHKEPIWPGDNAPYDHKPTFYIQFNIKTSLSYTLITICILGILSAIFFLQFNVRHRNHKYIRLSSPNINNVIIFGCIMGYICVTLYNIDMGLIRTTSVSMIAMIRMWTLAAAFSLCFGALFSKSWRIYKIFLNKDLKKIVIKDIHLIMIVIAFIMIDGFIFLLWFCTDPPVAHKVFSNQIEITGRDNYIIHYVWIATSTHQVKWLISLYAFKGLILAFGAFLAYETRHVKVSAVNDSKQIGISVYCMSTVAVLFAMTSLFVDTLQVDVKTGLGCVSILVGTTITLFLVFLPKVLELERLKKFPDSRVASSHDSSNIKVTFGSSANYNCKIQRKESNAQSSKVSNVQQSSK